MQDMKVIQYAILHDGGFLCPPPPKKKYINIKRKVRVFFAGKFNFMSSYM